MAVTQAQAAKHLLKLKKAQNSFVDFVKLCNPEMTFAPFQIELMETLDKLAKGTLGKNKLLITMPPRHANLLLRQFIFLYFISLVNRLGMFFQLHITKTYLKHLVGKFVTWLVNNLLNKPSQILKCLMKVEQLTTGVPPITVLIMPQVLVVLLLVVPLHYLSLMTQSKHEKKQRVQHKETKRGHTTSRH